MSRDLRIGLYLTAAMLVVAEAIGMTGIVVSPSAAFRRMFGPENWVFNLGAMALHPLILYVAYAAPNWRAIAGTVLAGLALDLVLLPYVPAPPPPVFLFEFHVLSAGPGLASLAMLVYGSLRANDARRRDGLALLGGLLMLQLYMLANDSYLHLTEALHPATYDAVAYRIDASLGFLPSVTAVLLARTHELGTPILLLAYTLLPYFASLLYALQVRSRLRWPAGFFTIVVVSGAIGYTLYQLCPITGPQYAFGAAFPEAMKAADQYPLQAEVVRPAARNAMPSMHFAWALLLWFNARPLHPAVRSVFALLLGFTVLATLGLGEHYLIDLFAGASAALAMQGLCVRVLPWAHAARRDAVLAGSLLTLAWVLAVRLGADLFSRVPGLTWALAAVTTVVSALLFARLEEAWRPQAVEPPLRAPPAAIPSLPRGTQRAAVALFLISGFAGLVYQVLFSKALALTFGSTSTATYTVLATYMGGMALGAWLGGALAERRGDALRLYGLCELGIGLFCLATPALFRAIQDVYVAAASGIPADAAVLTVFRVGLGALSLAVPTLLMGMTLPLLARFFGGHASLGVPVAILYSANTLGAALGALLAAYVIIPGLGIFKTTLLAAAANLLVALIAIRMQKGLGALPAPAAATPPRAGAAETRALGALALVLLTAGGFVTLALEVNYVHLLAVVAGNSVYAFGLMLFAFLLGLGAGSEFGRRLLAAAASLPLALGFLELGLAGAILGGVFMWDDLPRYFASYGDYPYARSFASRELIRGIVCVLAMFPAAFFIGALYPVAMECVGRAFPRRRLAMLGQAAALNTAGNIAGVLVAGFIALPALGALRSIQALAALSLAMGVAAIALSPWRRRLVAWAPAAMVLALLAAQPRSFDYTALASGANVYFQNQGFGTVIDHAESVDGGLTTVARLEGGSLLTLLTNGKFQGNNALQGEMRAQVGIAVAPLLHTQARDRALIIGYGTGVSARAMHEAGFGVVDIVDLSADIVRLADRHFGDVNGGVTGRRNVNMHITDGRNFLLLHKRQYDVISMEISSIWFAGAASLYNREFYRLLKQRLRAGGVLQQWVQLHHIAPIDILYVLGSVRTEFRHVWLYVIGGQGIIVASNDRARAPSRDAFARLERTASFQPLLQILRSDAGNLLDTLLLDPGGVDALLASVGAAPGVLVSTDDNLFLEYHTPKGNALDGEASWRDNHALLRSFGPRAASVRE